MSTIPLNDLLSVAPFPIAIDFPSGAQASKMFTPVSNCCLALGCSELVCPGWTSCKPHRMTWLSCPAEARILAAGDHASEMMGLVCASRVMVGVPGFAAALRLVLWVGDRPGCDLCGLERMAQVPSPPRAIRAAALPVSIWRRVIPVDGAPPSSVLIRAPPPSINRDTLLTVPRMVGAIASRPSDRMATAL